MTDEPCQRHVSVWAFDGKHLGACFCYSVAFDLNAEYDEMTQLAKFKKN
jgi:hypothetical protein